MFEQTMEKFKPIMENKEWVYLVRILLLVGMVGFLLYMMYFSWWMPSATEPAKKRAVDTSLTTSGDDKETSGTLNRVWNTVARTVEGKDYTYRLIREGVIIDTDTYDVLQCSGDVSRENCTYTAYNCANIADFDLWLAPEDNLERCNRNDRQQVNRRYSNPHTPPQCVTGQRLWFTPATGRYECK